MTTRELFADGALTVPAAVAFSGISRSLLFELMKRGELAYTRNGSKRLIARKALVAYLAARAADSPAKKS